MKKKWILLAPLVLVGFAVFVALGGWAVMQLWNWLLPPLFGWHTVTIWQALGLLVLCRLLFGGFGMQSGGRSRMGERFRARARERAEARLGDMPPADREHFRQRMRERFGPGPAEGPPQGE